MSSLTADGSRWVDSGMGNASRLTIAGAYQSVMFGAAVLAALSAIIAALTFSGGDRRDRTIV